LKEGRASTLWSEGEVRDVQPQKDGSFILTGGPGIVSGVRRTSEGVYRTLWTWEEMNLPCLVNAVGADWGWKGEPALILASDCTLNRLILGEARTRSPKIRWEFKLPAAPQRASLCPDTGNFLVTMRVNTVGMGAPPQVAEVNFREDRVDWFLDAKNGLVKTQDAVRMPSGRTLVVAGKKATLYCFDRGKNLQWEKPLAATAEAWHALSLVKSGQRTLLWISAVPDTQAPSNRKGKSRSRRPSGAYLVDPDQGRILAFRRSLTEGPAPLNAVPEDASFIRGR